MIWHRVIFTNSELSRGLSRELERDFNYLFNKMNQPEDMKLYRTWLVGDNHLYYYMQMPESFGYNLGKVFKQYRTTFTTEPDTKNLVLAIGIGSEAMQKVG